MDRSRFLERLGARLGMWRSARPAPHRDGQLALGELQRTCDRLFVRVGNAGRWDELRDCATELRFLTLHVERLVEDMKNTPGIGRSYEIDAVAAALVRVRQSLSVPAPAPRTLLNPDPMLVARRTTLYEALWHLRYVILLLGWARLETPRRQARSG